MPARPPTVRRLQCKKACREKANAAARRRTLAQDEEIRVIKAKMRSDANRGRAPMNNDAADPQTIARGLAPTEAEKIRALEAAFSKIGPWMRANRGFQPYPVRTERVEIRRASPNPSSTGSTSTICHLLESFGFRSAKAPSETRLVTSVHESHAEFIRRLLRRVSLDPTWLPILIEKGMTRVNACAIGELAPADRDNLLALALPSMCVFDRGLLGHAIMRL
ncbi:hypothetical protein C8R46DRAFT_1362272 [Mycena filopes]|nr:hypothetical protein C8R46DRAFT_1362272 [Mycena filopes]